MTRIVRQQMICILAPAWPGEASIPPTLEQSLKGLFCDVGVVHFASIALLPAMPDATHPSPSLMLELCIEEGISPYDLLYRLVHHPDGAMQSLYQAYCSAPSAPASERNRELLRKLMDWHHIADGAFVGTRDRTVQQIMKERNLLKQTREAAHMLKPHRDDRTSLALALSQWAFANPSLEWAREPAPRSFWRGKGAGLGAKLLYLALGVGLWLGLAWLVDATSQLLAGADAGALAASLRFLLALLVTGFALTIFFVILPALFKPWRQWLASLRRELDRPTDTWSSWSTYFCVWLVGLPLALAVIWSTLIYTFRPDDLYRYTIGMLTPAAPGWTHVVVGLAIMLVLLGIGIVFYHLDRWFPRANDRFYHPHRGDVERAQQVHPSIERGEAELVGYTAHMISLTDMRGPTWWSVWWTRVILRIVTFAGRVFYTEGRLGHAPGIHFGHWHIIDNGRRYLFCSNFDGTFGGYLDDFINGASAGTTLAWRWTRLKRRKAAAADHPEVAEPRAFPPSRFLVFRGVKCELRFKSYARDSMIPHLFRFDACNTAIDEANRATTVRDALFGERNESNDDQIMRAIES